MAFSQFSELVAHLNDELRNFRESEDRLKFEYVPTYSKFAYVPPPPSAPLYGDERPWDTFVFRPAPVHNPWVMEIQQPLSGEWPRPEPRKKKVRNEPKIAFPTSGWEITGGGIQLGFRMITSAPEAKRAFGRAAEQAAYEKKVEEKPRNIDIAGWSCPRIGNNWFAYQRKKGETFADWQRRISKIVRTNDQFRDLYTEHCVQRGFWKWCEKLSKRLIKRNPFRLLEIDAFERIPVLPPHRRVKVQKKVVVVNRHKFADEISSYQADRLAFRKDMHELQQLWKSCRAARRHDLRRVVHFDRKTHSCVSLKEALVNSIYKMASKHRDVFLDATNPLVTTKRFTEVADGQMDTKDAHGEDDKPITDQKSNVVMEDKAGTSTSLAVVPSPIRNEFSCLAAPPSPISAKTYVDRWITINKGYWQSEGQGEILFQLDLPKELLNNKEFRNSPNYAPFQNHTYWKGNMKVKIVMNSNLRMYGQFQVRFYYMAYADKHFQDLRTNVYTGSQQPHILMNAATSNIGELTIPFEYTCANLCISRSDLTWDEKFKNDDFANLGTLLGVVLIPLTVAQTTAKKVGYSVLIAFEESEFGGLIDKSIVEFKLNQAQMFSAAAMLYALHEANTSNDNNRDNPTASMTGMPMFPVNAGSWCIGNGLAEWSNVLRLNPNSSTPYPPGRVPPVDEMKISHIKDIFGLFRLLHWDAQQPDGKLLTKFHASPLLDCSAYQQMNVNDGQAYCVPPVGVLTSMFAWWRGSLQLRCDVIGASELTGRLMVAYTPRYYGPLTIEQANNCSNAIWDLQEKNRQFVFDIPYVADRMFWERPRLLKEEYQDVPPPGTIYIFVYNQLVANSTIPDDCWIALYIKGGEDFEVSVPAFPHLALSFNAKIDIDKSMEHTITPISGYTPMYIGTWRYFTLIPVYRYGEVSDHVTQFSYTGDLNLVMNCVMQTNAFLYPAFKVACECSSVDGTKTKMVERSLNHRYAVFVMDYSGYIYGTPMHDQVAQQVLAVGTKDLKELMNSHSQSDLSAFSALMVEHWMNSFMNYDVNYPTPTLNKIIYTTGEFITVPIPVYNITAIPKGQAGDERSSTIVKPSRPQASACGKAIGSQTIFGERFFDLKDYCRRYQLYCRGSVKIDTTVMKSRNILLKMPLLPQGLDLEISKDKFSSQYDNRAREGPIPLIASGYRFYTGGIRMRLVLDIVHQNEPISCKVFLQHRPDMINTALKVGVRNTVIIGTDDIELPSYASYFQYDEINNVMCIEIPNYLPVVRALLQRPSGVMQANRWSSLGELAVGITISNSTKAQFLNYEVYYSLADDARFSVFVGFPPLIDVSNIPPSHVAAAITEADSYEILTDVEEERPIIHKFIPPGETGEGEMGLFDFFSKTNDAVDQIAKIDIDGINETMQQTKTMMQKAQDTIFSNIPSITTVAHKLERYMSLIINVVTNLIHCLLNLNIKAIAVAVLSIFAQLKLLSYSVVTKITDPLMKLFQAMRSSNELNAELIETAVGEMGDDDEIIDASKIAKDNSDVRSAFVSTLIAGIAATLALGPKMAKSNYTSVFFIIFDGLKSFAMTANHLFVFIKNNLLAMQRIGNWLMDDSPKIKDIEYLKLAQADIYDWASEVINLTNPWKEDELFSDIVKSSRVHELTMHGSIMLMKVGKLKLDSVKLSVLQKLHENITRLRDRLVKSHKAPPVRWEPFVYELTGPTGTGKSQLLQTVPFDLMNSMNIKHRGEPIYHRALGNAYWNNCHGQPICSIDEKFPVAKPGFDDVQIAELFQLKSRCIFNPPMADIPDKNLRYNPLIVQYASNKAFPQLTGVLDPDAVNRRRDCLIKVDFNPAIKQKYAHLRPVSINKLTYDDRRNYNCLVFHFAGSTVDEANVNWGPPLTYEQFREKLIEIWKEYYVNEERMFRENLARVVSLAPRDGETAITFEQRWKESMGVSDPEDKLTKFAEDYRALLSAYKSQKEFNDDRGNNKYKFFGNIFKYFSKPNMTLEESEIKAQIDALEKEQYRLNWDNKMPEPKDQIVGQGTTTLTNPTPGNPETYYLKCPHSLLMKKELFNRAAVCIYDADEKFWSITDEEVLDSFNEMCDSFDLEKTKAYLFPGLSKEINNSQNKEINDHPETLYHNSGCYYVSTNKCKIQCDFDEKTYMSNMALFIKHKPVLASALSGGNFELLTLMLPEDYCRALSESICPKKKAYDNDKELSKIGWLHGWYDSIRETLLEVHWRKWIQRLAILSAVIFFMGTLWSIWSVSSTAAPASGLAASAILADSTRDLQGKFAYPQAFASGDYRHGAVKPKQAHTVAQKIVAQTSGQMKAPNFQYLEKCLQRNTFFLSLRGEGESLMVGRCLGICGRYALVVNHYWEGWNKFSKIHNKTLLHYIPCSQATPTLVNIDLHEIKYNKISNSEMAIIKLPVRIPIFKDIRNAFIKKEHHNFLNGMGTIYHLNGNDNGLITSKQYNLTFTPVPHLIAKGTDYYSDYTINSCYKYENFQGKGYCGSVLASLFMQAPIIGIHTAGNVATGVGYSEVVYREMFDDLDNCATAEMGQYDCESSNWSMLEGVQVIGLGAVPPRFAHHANDKSRIIPSEVQNAKDQRFPVYTEIAVLAKKDKRIEDKPFSPMKQGCAHHGKPLLPFNSEDLKLAISDMNNLILTKCKPQRLNVGLLTQDEAIAGFPGVDGYEHLEWNSSEGYPFVGFRPPGASNKRWLFNFDAEGHYKSMHPMLESKLKTKWEQRLNNEIPQTVFTDCLKDCTIDKAKVLTPGKTRIFSISPVDFTIQQRQCTLDFSVAYMSCRLDLEHAIGINPDSVEWTTLMFKLLTPGDNILTGDYSKFGDTIPVEIIHAFYETVINWYRFNAGLTSDHLKQLNIMSNEIGNSVHLMFNFLYQVVCGQPSGNSLTVILNSYSNSIYVRLAWLAIMRDTKYNSLVDLHKHVKWYSYGDDLIAALTDEIKDIFNAQSICKFFASHNLKFTNADKDESIIPYTNISKAEFLKRGFTLHPLITTPQIILAPLGVNSIEDTVNWVNKDSFGRDNIQCPNFRAMSLQVCEDSLRNAFGRGPQYYENFRLKLTTFWRERGVNFISAEWHQLSSKVYLMNEPLHEYYKFKPKFLL